MTCEKKLAEIKERLGKATKGEWHWKFAMPNGGEVWGPNYVDQPRPEYKPFCIDDAKFIAHSRTDIETLIKMVEAIVIRLKNPAYHCCDLGSQNCSACGDLAELDQLAGEAK